MELRRGHEEDAVGLQNSMGYSSPPLKQHESSARLPTTIPASVSTLPEDRRRNENSRGTTISGPSPTQDQNNLIHQHLQLQEEEEEEEEEEIPKDSNPDSDPAQVANAIITGATNSKTSPHRSQPQGIAPASNSNSASTSSVRYRECLKNHAATMGGHVVDGCGEFMPGGEEGTPEALRCAACDCHRNFHRKESDGEHHHRNTNTTHHHASVVFRTQPQSSLLAMPPHQQRHKYSHHGFATTPAGPVMMAFWGNGGVPAESSSEDLNIFQYNHAGGQAVMQLGSSKKRFRTKFTQQQKERMHEFAEKLGWKMQKQDEQLVHQFCNEVGVKRQVFKVWMHNNKQAMKKRQV